MFCEQTGSLGESGVALCFCIVHAISISCEIQPIREKKLNPGLQITIIMSYLYCLLKCVVFCLFKMQIQVKYLNR